VRDIFTRLGQIAETLVLRRHLIRFLMRRNAALRSIAESNEQWQRYLATDGRPHLR
jgi:hypothetical protein